MQTGQAIVRIIDDDPEVRDSLSNLLKSAGFTATTFASPSELLQCEDLSRPGCIILDVRLAGASGLDFQQQLQARNIPRPVIIMTGYGDIPMTVKAMKAGAVDFLTKPFREQALLDSVASALRKDAAEQDLRQRNARLHERYGTLTTREREVCDLVITGRMNKQIAADLGISEVTVKLHRGNAMRKMEARSLADLVRKMEKLDRRDLAQ
ncbi:response regulator transcription factor [Martelella endophytica]|uniref:Nodulation protein W n=1 Tax=Martelella endophytica TaxID=1486262 RepID=A0A0D5LRB2_MAREN|nr:response regulator transcription factor [Martelella endophytica]AJY45858.1 hypothetical protein TM49_09490 [Martelella endophytica]